MHRILANLAVRFQPNARNRLKAFKFIGVQVLHLIHAGYQPAAPMMPQRYGINPASGHLVCQFGLWPTSLTCSTLQPVSPMHCTARISKARIAILPTNVALITLSENIGFGRKYGGESALLIISLSSIPPRFPKIAQTLEALLAQTAQVDHVLLYIPKSYRRFPDWDGKLPEVPSGVEIRRTDKDYGPATKLLAAAKEFRGQDCNILFCDDDHLYTKEWAQRFIDLQKRHQNCCITLGGWHTNRYLENSVKPELQPRAVRRWRITDIDFQTRYLWQDLRAGFKWKTKPEPGRKIFIRSGYIDIFEGYGGVLVRPEYFDDESFDIPDVIWAVDDVWLSGMVARKGIPIWLQAGVREAIYSESESTFPLHDATIEGADRDAANVYAVEYIQKTYEIWL